MTTTPMDTLDHAVDTPGCGTAVSDRRASRYPAYSPAASSSPNQTTPMSALPPTPARDPYGPSASAAGPVSAAGPISAPLPTDAGTEDEGMIPARAPRSFLDQVAEAWRTRPAGAWIGAAAAGFYQLLLWKLPMAGNTEVQTWHWAVANLLVIACLVGRRRWPLTVVALTGIASVLGQLLGAGPGLGTPPLIAVYALIATTGTGPVRCAIGLILATICDVAPDFLISSPFPLISRLLPSFVLIAMVVTAALLSRSRRRTLEHRDAQLAARAAERRLAGTPWHLNAEVPGSYLRGPDGGLSAPLSRRLMTALERGDLSLRGVDRVLRLAWTLADLEGVDTLSLTHIGTALALRTSGVRP